jgi:hypothetical protein
LKLSGLTTALDVSLARTTSTSHWTAAAAAIAHVRSPSSLTDVDDKPREQ